MTNSMPSTTRLLEFPADAEPSGRDTLLARALKVFVGSAVRQIREEKELTDFEDSAAGAVFSLSPSAELRKAIKKRGFIHNHTFIALPSRGVPRWIVPTHSRNAIVAATQIYEPHKWVMRLLKRSFIGATKMGWTGLCYPKVLVATKDTLTLERLVSAVTSESKPVFALSVGRQAAVRKLTVQVMCPNGEILGYMKLPLTSAAAERVRNEARILQKLWTFPALRPHIPRLLYAGEWCGTYVLFQCPLQGARGPTSFTEMHRSLLQKLLAVHAVRMSGRSLIEGIGANWKQSVPWLGAEWERLGQEVLERASRDLEGKLLRCGLVHGDFAPWNTRVWDERLLLFDWESATWAAPASWDIFHFQVHASYFFRKNRKFEMPKREPYEEISFMLYLLNSVGQFLAEDNHVAVAHYKTLLIGAFQGRQAWVEEPAPAA